MLRRSYTSAAAAHIHGRPRRETRDPRRCNGHPRPLPGAARRAAPLSANAQSTALVARARLPQAACCAVQGVGHDVSPCSGLPGAALGSGGAWRGARLLPGPSVRTRVGPLTSQADAASSEDDRRKSREGTQTSMFAFGHRASNPSTPVTRRRARPRAAAPARSPAPTRTRSPPRASACRALSSRAAAMARSSASATR